MNYAILKGSDAPLGTSQKPEGINFAVFSHDAEKIILSLFNPGEECSFLDVELFRTGDVWHALVSGLPEHAEYGYHASGPYDPCQGKLFNSTQLLSDPYARSLNTPHHWGTIEMCKELFSPRGKLICSHLFDWQGDSPPKIPLQDLVIYEMHVRGFTQDPSSKTMHPGTYLGVIEKIPHLKEMGVNAVELLPIFEFNESEYRVKNPLNQSGLCNYWGYSTVNFFSPMNRYASASQAHSAIEEFKMMVRALHQAGIEVILDVVFNHTAEGGEQGPYFSFRGLDNQVYYMVDDKGNYRDYTGCGNSVNANHPVVAQFILDALRYWVTEMHVDGFRFDLASVLTRDPQGYPFAEPPVIKMISKDPVLAHVKLIAEAWDAAGLYQVGSFPSWHRWYEWNGKYRDATRRFLKGTDSEIGEFARVICGSQHLYGHDRLPLHSVNFITAHDGFTLRDLVSYQGKHNEANGEENRDGTNQNESWNCGEEGNTTNPEVLNLRGRQMRNLHLALILSIGTPMILMGDEYGHTRLGNNNTWCQDNTLNWFLWNELEKEGAFFRFYRLAIHFRHAHPLLKRTHFLKNTDIDWHGVIPFKPDWGETSRFIAYTLKSPSCALYIAFNAHFAPLSIILPPAPPHRAWKRIVDTSLPSPEDFCETPSSTPSLESTYEMPSYSAILLEAF